MEPLTITTGTLALVRSIVAISISISTFTKDVNDAKADLNQVCRELDSLTLVLNSLASHTDRLQRESQGSNSLVRRILEVIQDCEKLIEELETLIKKYDTSMRRRIAWAMYGKSNVEKLSIKLQANNRLLSFSLEVVNSVTTHRIRDDTSAMRREAEEARAELASLRDQMNRLIEALQTRGELSRSFNVQQWVFDVGEYAESLVEVPSEEAVWSVTDDATVYHSSSTSPDVIYGGGNTGREPVEEVEGMLRRATVSDSVDAVRSPSQNSESERESASHQTNIIQGGHSTYEPPRTPGHVRVEMINPQIQVPSNTNEATLSSRRERINSGNQNPSTTSTGPSSPMPEPARFNFNSPQSQRSRNAANGDGQNASSSPNSPARPSSGSVPALSLRRNFSPPRPRSPPPPTPFQVPFKDSDFSLDSIIERLLSVRGSRPGTQIQLLDQEIRILLTKARDVFISQPVFLELEAPLKVTGTICGQYYDLLRIFEYSGFPPEANYLFLGDYVSKGKQGIETICLLLAFKVKYPENFFLLRGNHECASINRIYGFYDECRRRYNEKLWKTFTDCFNCMPIAALIDEKIFCMHGGLSPDLNSLEQLRYIMRPTDIPDCGLLCDLLWADPDKDIIGWGESDRGVSFTFGPDVVSRFCQKHDLDLIVRSHQVVENGYEFFSQQQLVTVFAVPNYCGEYDNAGAVMSIDESLMCSFERLLPAKRKFV